MWLKKYERNVKNVQLFRLRYCCTWVFAHFFLIDSEKFKLMKHL